MGNVLEVETAGDDVEYLKIPNSSIFNDNYLSEIYEKLPNYEGSAIDKKKKKAIIKEDTNANLKISRLSEIYVTKKDAIASVQDYQKLNSFEDVEESSFTNQNKMRSRLLQRIYVAYHREVLSRTGQMTQLKDNYFFEVNAVNKSYEDANGLMIAMSIRMSLAIMKCLGPSNPNLFASMAQSIMELLTNSTDLALAAVKPFSPQGECLKSIFDFTCEVTNTSIENRLSAIALMFAVALTSGSLEKVLTVVKYLQASKETVLTNAAKDFLVRLETMKTPLDLTVPTPTAIGGELTLTSTFSAPEETFGYFGSSFCVDGSYIYIWNGLTKCIHKIGTGYHSTIAGNEYLVINVESLLQDRLADEIVESEPVNKEEETAEPTSSHQTLRVLKSVSIVTLPEGATIEEFVLGEVAEIDIRDAVVGARATVYETRKVSTRHNADDEEKEEDDEESDGLGNIETIFYRIGEREWIPAVVENEEESSEESSSESSDFSSEHELVRVPAVELIDSDDNSGGSQKHTAESFKQAWIVIANGKLYFRMKHILGPYRVAVFSTNTLKLEDVLELNLPITEWDAAKAEAQKSNENGEEESKEEDSSNEIDWDYGAEKSLLSDESILVNASSNYRGAMEDAERNLIANDAAYRGDVSFVFAESDNNQEFIVDLGRSHFISKIGAQFEVSVDGSEPENQVHDKVFFATSQDGVEFVQYGNAVESGHLVSPTYMSDPNAADPSQVTQGRYVKFNFGKHAPSGKGSRINRLFVHGYIRSKKPITIPFPVMSSDGRNLIFVCFTSEKSKNLKLKSYLVNPSLGMDAISESTYEISSPTSESQLLQCSIVFNSEVVLLAHNKKFVVGNLGNEADICFWKLQHESGALLSYTETKFVKNKGIPYEIYYDLRNNMIWGWDCFGSKFLKWRNSGLAPRKSFVKNDDVTNMMLSSVPQSRLEGLKALADQDEKNSIEAAYILAHLDRLAVAHGPPTEPCAELNTTNEIEVIAAGFEDGCFCKLLVRGIPCGTPGRGFNVLVLTEEFRPAEFRNFDTHEQATESERMADFIESIPEGRLVLVGTMDSAVANLSPRGIAALVSLGADRLNALAFRGSFAMITKKGFRSKLPIQKIVEKRKGSISVKLDIPAIRIPLCVEPTKSTISSLVHICWNHYELIKSKVATIIDKNVFLSATSLLTTNVFQLLRGTPISVALSSFEETERKYVVTMLMDIIDSPESDDNSFTEVAVNLFMTSIDILYPSIEEKCGLLLKYFDEFLKQSLSPLKSSVLELLLRQMSEPRVLQHLFNSSKDGNYIKGTDLIASLLSIAKNDALEKLKKSRSRGNVGEAAIQMLSTLCNIVWTLEANKVTSKEENLVESDSMKFLTRLSSESIVIVQQALEANESYSYDKCTELDDDIDDILKTSLVGALLPVNLKALSMLITHLKPNQLKEYGSGLSDNISNVLVVVKELLCLVPKEKLFLAPSDASTNKTSSSVYESEHPYLSNTDSTFELKFAGAVKMTITFDEESKTENNYDWVKFWKNPSKTDVWHEDVEKYTGRQGSENWPGFGGRPPLVIEGDEAFVEFHSDGSNEDWGWRFTVVVEYKKQSVVINSHWLLELEKQLCYAGSVLSSALIIGSQIKDEKEDSHAAWLEDSLLQFGFTEKDQELCREDLFLQDFLDRPEGSDASQFCKKMKKLVTDDQGQVDDVNRAVYISCAALIKLNNLTAEALDFAKDSAELPSDGLLKVWKAGQKMRSFFNYGDVKTSKVETDPDLEDMPPPSILQRGPSIYSGADANVVKSISQGVIERAQFLLRVNSAPNLAVSPSKTAKKHWNLLSKVALSGANKTTSENSDRLHALVDEVQSAYKLKDMLAFRRKAAEKRHALTISTTEKLLRFIQSSINITEIESIRLLRNDRAAGRTLGFNIVTKLIDAASSPSSVAWLMSHVATSLRSTTAFTKGKNTRIHYLNGIEGCSQEQRESSIKAFSILMEKCVSILSFALDKFEQETIDLNERTAWKEVLLSCLRAFSIDYDSIDHSFLEASGILNQLHSLLKCSNFDIQLTAWNLFEVLLPRCVGLEGQKAVLNDEPSEFSKKLVALLVTHLDIAAAKVSKRSSPKLIELRSDLLGYTSPHRPMGLQHTFSFWIRRPNSDFENHLHTGTPKEGLRVMQGPDWPAGNLENGGENARGTIVKVESNSKLVVKWDNKLQKSYKFGVVEEGTPKYEISIVSEGIGGHIYSKGLNSLLNEDDRNAVWSSFGMEMKDNATVRMFASSGSGQNFYLTSKSIIPPSVWTHVTFVQDQINSKLYLNGTLDAEAKIPNHMLYPGKGNKSIAVVESPHPYRDNSDEYVVVEIPGALSYTVSFDPQTKTELNYDFIRFYKDDSHSEYWGEEKYSGGRSNSNSNWPGLNGAPPLVIPSGRFVVYFKSDGSNNDWGYKIICAAELPAVLDDSREVLQNLNDMPIYVGQAPGYANNSVKSLTGHLYDFNISSRSLDEDEIKLLVDEAPEVNCDEDDEIICLNVLSMINRSCKALCGTTSQINSTFIGIHVLRPLLNLLAYGSPYVQCSALRLSSNVLIYFPAEMLDTQAKLLGLTNSDTFFEYLLQDIGSSLNSFGRNSNDRWTVSLLNEVRLSIAIEKLRLLQSLTNAGLYCEEFANFVGRILDNTFPEVLRQLEVARHEEIVMGKTHDSVKVRSDQLDLIYAFLGYFGGTFNGFYTGSSAKYILGDENSILEDCIILAPMWPPQSSATDSKESSNLWKDCSNFGDAYAIVVLSQPSEYAIVPNHKLVVSSSRPEKVLGSIEKALQNKLSGIENVFSYICKMDCSDKRDVYLPKVQESDEVQTFESTHPYADNLDTITEVKFPGAKEIIIEFSSASRTETNCDYVKFYKDNSKSSYWGLEKYHGRGGEENWPGTGGRPPLIIPADSFVLHFHSDGSTNDWGYLFNARAHCVQRCDPPVRPPLLHNVVSSSIQFLGMQSLLSLINDFSWFSSSAVSLIQPLLKAALQKTSAIATNEANRKPIMLESNHPYDHNKDDYIPVRIRGARRLVITFDESTATENGCDYVRFYKDDSRSEYWGENQYTGGKDGGNSNWPSLKGRPPLIIPSDSFVLYFHSDGSVNAWGWKLWVTPDYESSNSLSGISALECNYRAFCYQNLMYDGPARQLEPINLNEFESKPFVEEDGFLSEYSVKNVSLPNTKFDDNLNQQEKDELSNILLVNKKEILEVSLRQDKDPDSEVVCNIPLLVQMTLQEEVGDWCRVTCSLNNEAKEGWVLRKNGDAVYVTQERRNKSNVKQDEDLITIDNDIDGTSASKVKVKHPMYNVKDSQPHSGLVDLKDKILSPVEVLKSKHNYIRLCLYNVLQTGSSKIAEECISKLIVNWPKETTFNVQTFGSDEKLINYMRSLYSHESITTDESGFAASPSLTILKDKLLEVMRADPSDSLAATLIDYATNQLIVCINLETSLPPTRAKIKTLQSKHPYDDNMDESTTLTIPGAKWLKIVFDKRSSTEKDCDYVTIYKDSSKTESWGTRYTGRENSSDKVWAGVGSTPPCIVLNDTCVVHFHSDGSNNDWGYNITCYGIMEEPSAELVEKIRNEKNSSKGPMPELACWLLDFLVKEKNAQVLSRLYSSKTMKTLRKYCEVMPDNKKIFVVNLLTNMLQELSNIKLSKESHLEISILQKLIPSLAASKQKEELLVSGGNVHDVSQLLQALIQAAITLESIDIAKRDQEDAENLFVFDTAVSVGDILSSRGNLEVFTRCKDSTLVCTPTFSPNRRICHFQLISFSTHCPIVGIYFSEENTYLGWSDSTIVSKEVIEITSFGPQFEIGDVISVEYDCVKRSIAFYRNFSLVGKLPIDLTDKYLSNSTNCSPCLISREIGDQISILSSLDDFNISDSISISNSVPDWIRPIKKVVSLLKCGLRREMSKDVVLNEFLPRFQEKCAVVLESAHPFTGTSSLHDVMIPGSSSLELSVDPLTKLNPEDVIRVTVGDKCILDATFSSIKLGHSGPAVAVGDLVVRGKDWEWGNQDGAIGNIGEVLAIRSWKGYPNAAVEVKWLKSEFTSVYRFGFDALFDVKLIKQVKTLQRPLKINGDSVRVEVIPKEEVTAVTTADKALENEWTGAYYFDGSSCVIAESRSELELNNDSTVEAWIKVDPKVSGDSNNVYPILSRTIEVDGKYLQYSLQLGYEGESGINTLVLHTTNTEFGVAVHLTGGNIFSGVWTHVAAVMLGSVTSLLVNGVVVATTSTIHGSGRMESLGAPLTVGGGNGKYFKGFIYDLRIWRCGKSAETILNSKNTVINSKQENLVSHLLTTKSTIDGYLMDQATDNLVTANGLTWSTSVERHIMPTGAVYGYKLTITPTFKLLENMLELPKYLAELNNFKLQYSVGDARHDLALVRYVNSVTTAKNMDINQICKCSWSDIAPQDKELITMPVLKELIQFEFNAQHNLEVEAEVESPPTLEANLLNAAGVKMSQGNGSCCTTFYCGRSLGMDVIPGSDGRCGPNNGPQCPDCLATASPNAYGDTMESTHHTHKLKLQKGLNNHMCDVCREENDYGVFWKCAEECDFDLCMACALREKKGLASTPSKTKKTKLVRPVEIRFKFLQQLNLALSSTLSYFDLCLVDKEWSISRLVAASRGLIFEVTKRPIWNAALTATNSPAGSAFELKLSRPRAARFIRTGQVDHDARWMVFSQAFRHLHTMHPASLRRTDKLYNTVFIGEKAYDAGGPYRESFVMYAQELQSSSLPLLIRVPNERHSVGQNREKWILNPGATSSLHMEMFCFLGKLMGIAIRTKEYLALNIPSIIWKLLVEDTPTREDLEGIDLFQIKALDNMRNMTGVTAETFSQIFYETFTVVSSDERNVELFPGGSKIDVTYENREQFCDLVENYRLHEFDTQAAAVRRGLAAMIPITLLSLYTWDQLEVMVCGLPTVDLALLKSVTEYSSCTPQDPHVQFFWQAMEEFSHEERSHFLKFIWGRSRLPLSADGFSQRMKIQSFNKSPPDNYLPVSHTCFFSLELPRYSSLEIMKDKLRYAIFNCQAIDGDDTSVGMIAQGMGWDE